MFCLLANNMHIGKAIKNLRQLAGLTQTQVGEGIGKTKGLISQIEKTGNVNHYTLVKIAKKLNTSPEKIEQYQKSLANPKHEEPNAPAQSNLPEFELLKLENLHLKEQILLLKKTIVLLESKL